MQLELQVACATGTEIPDFDQLGSWVTATLDKAECNGGDLTIRIVDESEMADLNYRYRGKSGTTNVLSFPFEAVEGLQLDIFGDLVICASVVAAEAGAQGKSLTDHWAHMVIHGTLHLCGFDHQLEQEAEQMELLEMSIMAGFGIANPYTLVLSKPGS